MNEQEKNLEWWWVTPSQPNISWDFAKSVEQDASSVKPTFKVGDKVKLVNTSDSWLKKTSLSLGEISIITALNFATSIMTNKTNGYVIENNCFELVKCCDMCFDEFHCPLCC